MSSREITLWLDEHWYQALSQQLEVDKLEDKLNEYLDDQINLLPTPVYEKIIGEIREEEQQREQAIAASQRYAVFHVTENGRDEHFRLDENYELLQAARTLRKYLRQESGAGADSFSELFPKRETITPEEFDRMILLRLENTGMVTGVFDLDFDKREFSAVNTMTGWSTWAMGDVSVAAYHAFRKESLNTDGRYRILLDKLNGREITSAGHLSARNISFAEEITEINGLLNFYMNTWFDVDAVFGTHICTSDNDDVLNVYANYDMAARQVCDTLEVDLHRADGREESVEYQLNVAEKEVLLWKMDAYCQEQTGQTLADYSAQLMTENMATPSQPSM
ncbi:hypothetical protein [Flintibacter muris]|uniref:hypothetical protein n=1 Tax=Flintibacter muris TaxID=2941327 RepID=UPI00203B426F|nr:hypothetical protein [Flintibacter muris]